ncbi:hypothetical protein [Acinetobacter rudis]|uniref:Uncharacterized protein n=1 Tax=Acinetobacter rudis TaxID=632955 RepID=A0AAW8J2J6_9GAMM|nr:hypothetical protein [Acinetobacter rudis]MDQ8934227.1 hypothetical protein [Acinetobacter rudis]MDQ8952616.1 hypothetical protein [Acinetobacter rudis]MDQ9016465.1 hypothetical protein [Acinetobacter rudis]
MFHQDAAFKLCPLKQNATLAYMDVWVVMLKSARLSIYKDSTRGN